MEHTSSQLDPDKRNPTAVDIHMTLILIYLLSNGKYSQSAWIFCQRKKNYYSSLYDSKRNDKLNSNIDKLKKMLWLQRANNNHRMHI